MQSEFGGSGGGLTSAPAHSCAASPASITSMLVFAAHAHASLALIHNS